MGDGVGEAVERAQDHLRNATREGLQAIRALIEATLRASGTDEAQVGALAGEWKRALDAWIEALEQGGLSELPGTLAEPLFLALDAEIERWEQRSRSDESARPVLRAFLGARELLWELGLRRASRPDEPTGAPAPPGSEGASTAGAARVQRFEVED